MSADKSEGAQTPTRNWQFWLALVGTLLVAGGIITFCLGIALESDLLRAIGGFGFVAGYALFYFPEYLRLRVWPFVAISLPFVLGAAIALPIHNGILALICAPTGLGLLGIAEGVCRWKNRQQAKA